MTTSPYAALRHPVRPEALVSLDPQALRRVHAGWQAGVLAMLHSRRDQAALLSLRRLAQQLERLFQGTGAGLFWHLSAMVFLALESGDLRLPRGHRLGYAIQLEKTLQRMRQAHTHQHSVMITAAAAGALIRLVARAHPRQPAILLEQDRINLDLWLFGHAHADCCALPPGQALEVLVQYSLQAGMPDSSTEISPERLYR